MNFSIFITLRYTSFVLPIHREMYRHRHGMCVCLGVCKTLVHCATCLYTPAVSFNPSSKSVS